MTNWYTGSAFFQIPQSYLYHIFMINIILCICTQPTRGHWLTDAFDDGGSDDEVEFLPVVFH